MIGSGAKREMDNNRNYYKILLENTKKNRIRFKKNFSK